MLAATTASSTPLWDSEVDIAVTLPVDGLSASDRSGTAPTAGSACESTSASYTPDSLQMEVAQVAIEVVAHDAINSEVERRFRRGQKS
jgi:hypothetical protein